MRTLTLIAVPLFAVFAVSGGTVPASAPEESAGAQDEPFTVSGPHVHKNLSVFLLHGKGENDGKEYVPLAQAMADGIAVVYETGNVDELAIENTSNNAHVYAQAGDIVKGGRQDRTL